MLDEDDAGSSNATGSGVMVNVNANGKRDLNHGKRGWDWRLGMKKGASGNDLLSILRLGLAKEVARAWIEGEEA